MNPDCHVEPVEKEFPADDLTDARIVRLSILGMGCANCGIRVRNGLLALAGVVSADVDWETALAFVDYVPAQTNVDAILAAVIAAGNDGHHNYSARVMGCTLRASEAASHKLAARRNFPIRRDE